jgi:phosphatidylglycerol:prolipoprotein diacylglycerol transferase
MDPILIQFGPIAIRYYGLMYLLAALVGGALFAGEVRRKDIALERDRVWDFVTLMLLSGILGARVYYVAFNWSFYGAHPGEIVKIWRGGLAIHGGLIGAVLAGWWFVRRHGLSFWRVADAAAPSVILGQAFGRFGNFMNGDAHGLPTDKPWGIVFPPDSIAGREFGPVPLHPTMLYELALNLVLFGILWAVRKRPAGDGFIFCLYLIGYAVIRFGVSFFRADDLYLGALRAPHVVSVLLVLVVGGYMLQARLWRAPAAPKAAARRA